VDVAEFDPADAEFTLGLIGWAVNFKDLFRQGLCFCERPRGGVHVVACKVDETKPFPRNCEVVQVLARASEVVDQLFCNSLCLGESGQSPVPVVATAVEVA